MPASVNPELKPNLAELKSHLDTTARLTKQMVPVVNLSTLRPKSSAGSRRHQSGRLLHMRVCHSTGLRQNMVLQIQDVPIARSPCAEDEQEHDHHEHDMPAAPVPKNIIDRTSLLKAGNVHVQETLDERKTGERLDAGLLVLARHHPPTCCQATEADPKIRMACSNRKVVTSVPRVLKQDA